MIAFGVCHELEFKVPGDARYDGKQKNFLALDPALLFVYIEVDEIGVLPAVNIVQAKIPAAFETPGTFRFGRIGKR